MWTSIFETLLSFFIKISCTVSVLGVSLTAELLFSGYFSNLYQPRYFFIAIGPRTQASETSNMSANANETTTGVSNVTTSNRGHMLHGTNIYVAIISAWKMLDRCD